MYIRHKHRGISLIELILFIVIVSIALAGILLVMNRVSGHSADPLIRKQEIAIAESMLEEIQLQDFNPTAANTNVNTANRSTVYHIVRDYNGYTTTGIYAPDGTAVPTLTNYNLHVDVTSTALTPTTGAAIPSTNSVLITVTVTNSTLGSGNALGQVVLDGYRTAY